MLTSKQRAEFRAQANSLETTLMVGKDGVTEAVIAEADKLLTARELVKGKVLETALMSAREVSDASARPPAPTAFPASVPNSSSGGSAKNVRPSATRPAAPSTRRLPSPRPTLLARAFAPAVRPPVRRGSSATSISGNRPSKNPSREAGSGSRESRSDPDGAIKSKHGIFLSRFAG